jgi:hypothetical protein
MMEEWMLKSGYDDGDDDPFDGGDGGDSGDDDW